MYKLYREVFDGNAFFAFDMKDVFMVQTSFVPFILRFFVMALFLTLNCELLFRRHVHFECKGI